MYRRPGVLCDVRALREGQNRENRQNGAGRHTDNGVANAVAQFVVTSIPVLEPASPATINVTITAEDCNGLTVTTYPGTATITTPSGNAVITGTWTNGIWSGTVADSATANDWLTITDTGIRSLSNHFAVYGTLAGFSFAPIASPMVTTTAFAVTITAIDANGVEVANYNGPPVFTATPAAGAICRPGRFYQWPVDRHRYRGQRAGDTGSHRDLGWGDRHQQHHCRGHRGELHRGRQVRFHADRAAPGHHNTAFSVTVTAETAAGATVANYTGTPAFTSTPASIVPNTGSTFAFSGGVWNGKLLFQASPTAFPANGIYQGAKITVATGVGGISSTSAGFILLENNSNPLAGFTFAIVPSPQTPGTVFAETCYAVDANGNAIPSYAANPAPTLESNPVGATFTGSWLDGQWSGNVVFPTIPTYDTGATLECTVAGNTGLSDPFNVYPPLAAYDFAPIASPQLAANPFNVTITAVDAFGTTYSNLNPANPLTVTAALLPTVSINAATPTVTTAGTMNPPLNTDEAESRLQTIYLASEINAAGNFGVATAINSLTLNVATIPGQSLTNFTVRMQNTTQASYSTSPDWVTTGWTTVYSGTLTITSEGALVIPFSTPFEYDGASNIMVDISFSDTSESTAGALATIRRARRAAWCIMTNYPRLRSPGAAPIPSRRSPSTLTFSSIKRIP